MLMQSPLILMDVDSLSSLFPADIACDQSRLGPSQLQQVLLVAKVSGTPRK